jgi:hypothetical protein
MKTFVSNGIFFFHVMTVDGCAFMVSAFTSSPPTLHLCAALSEITKRLVTGGMFLSPAMTADDSAFVTTALLLLPIGGCGYKRVE